MPDATTATTQQTAGTSTAATDATTQASTTTAATAADKTAQAATQATTTDAKTASTTTTAATTDATKAVAPMWGENWREEYAKTDEKRLGVLKRYTSPAAALDALFAARQKIDAGEVKAPLPKDATPEQLAAWRTDHGIPDKPEAYIENLPKEIKLDGIDKEALTSFAKTMHDANVPPDIVHKAVAWQAQQIEQAIATRQTADKELQTKTEDTLRAEWGNEYRANINNVHALLDTAPEGVSEAILNARLPDGSPLVGTPETVKWLAQMAREINPISTIVPGTSGATGLNGVQDRISAIEKMMRTNHKEYVKDEKVQQEYRELLDARERMNRKTAA